MNSVETYAPGNTSFTLLLIEDERAELAPA